uniref:DNA 3'-5' helicase n=1 Tax=Paulinella micropora TaxID=1928728 RepID=A0A385I1H4_9EUKA|nr:primosomal protein N' [Paulinella micropora]AXY63783.1 primosomal protein N' [Paulinella micropora]
MSPVYVYLDIWIEAGPRGHVFTYKNTQAIAINIGDLVKVYLRHYTHIGIVIRGRNRIPSELQNSNVKPVEEIFEPTTIDPNWYTWLHNSANRYHISFFRMLKTALPSQWLGNHKRSNKNPSYKQVKIGLMMESPIKRNNILTNSQLELIHWLRKQPNQHSMQSVLQEKKFSNSTINSLKKKNIIHSQIELTTKISPKPKYLNTKFNVFNIPLSSDQQAALRVFEILNRGHGILLWGVTGSGKTEVYIQAAAKQLEEGYNVLILTPEISLIPQLIDRCRKCFGKQVVEYHSICGKDDRARIWQASYNAIGRPIVVIGTRSAIFLPLNPLGLIILDEEHDNCYKQENPIPCYHARDLALRRSQQCNSKIILGSATPSLEAWRACQNNDSLTLVRLRQRIGCQVPPQINIVDMRLELKEGHRNSISRSLLYQLKIIKELGEQAIILVPRRGYSSFLSCRSCGTVVECPKCDVPLRVHQNKKQYSWLHCHWCDYKETIKQKCHDCGANAFKAFGIGTQQVMEQLEQALEGFRIIRFDRDSTREKDGHRQILAQFASGKADILVGTQMLSKGIDLPRVTLAAVLAADGLLHRPDLRSSEQSLQLLLQLAGRAGRGDRSGKVFIQTYYPQHPIMRYLVNGQYEDFLIKELTIRKTASLAPYRRTCIVHVSGTSDTITASTANIIAESIRLECKQSDWSLVGPFPAPVRRVANRSRWQILLHGKEDSILPLTTDAELNQLIPKDVHLKIDPDPINF